MVGKFVPQQAAKIKRVPGNSKFRRVSVVGETETPAAVHYMHKHTRSSLDPRTTFLGCLV